METLEGSKMEEKERSKLFLERLLKHQELTKGKKFYAIQRMDLLIISVSGAGIYIIFEMLRFFHGANPMPDFCAIKIAGISFAFSIVTNFFSQTTGYLANKHEVDSTELEISKEKGDGIDEWQLRLINNNVKFYNRLTTSLNITSTLFMLAGVFILTIFNLFIF